MSMPTYGRSRQSIANLEQELHDVFSDHPDATFNDENEPIIPAGALVDVLRTFSINHDAKLMTPNEEEQLVNLLKTTPGLDVTPQILLQFVAMRAAEGTKTSPAASPSPDESSEFEEQQRGRSQELSTYEERSDSRSSSVDSTGTSVWHPGSRPGSRPPSRSSSRGPPVPPKTPTNADTPFDVSSRQRTTPLKTAVPSSWVRPRPARRKSDAGSGLSDSESISSPPVAFKLAGGRVRAPSNPTSPSTSFSSFSPPSRPPSRPHSRTQSQPHNPFATFSSPEPDYDYDYDQTISSSSMASTGRSNSQNGMISPPPEDDSFDGSDDENFADRISSLPMPTKSESDSDEDEEDAIRSSLLGLVMSRSAASSTISLDLQERVDALQKTNMDLGKKLVEAENTLQVRLSDHEMELEELHSKLEAAKHELNATKREEKELRAKERTNSTQISALESEIAKLQKSLENARASYQSLQKQYQEQCHESERYRDLLRRRDEEIKAVREQSDFNGLEVQKLTSVAATYEAQIESLHQELELAQQAVSALDEQKQENLLLKETIDRMRYDMDEMRNSSTGHGPGSGSASIRGSVSKSLGAELMGSMQWPPEQRPDWAASEVEDEEDIVAGGDQDDEDDVEEILGEENETESEDVVQTIITRTKRRVGTRGRRVETVNIEEVKEYSDATTQHDISEFNHSMNIQTDPEPKVITKSFSVQTEERLVTSIIIQTDPEHVPEPIIRTDVDIQTDAPEPEPELEAESSSTQIETETEDETLASSSSTLLPPTPKAHTLDHPHPHDLPPAYNQVTGQDQDELAVRVANETLKKWHKGLQLPIEPVAGGISEDAIEEWKALKEELGIECGAIDKIVEESARTGLPRPSKDGRPRNRRSKFYNIYNTYVYGSGEKDGPSSVLSSGQFLFVLGASAAVAFIVGHTVAAVPQYSIPGGVTYYDRAAWASYNTLQAAGEGFPGDSTSAVWGFLGRLGGEAARSLRGWPT